MVWQECAMLAATHDDEIDEELFYSLLEQIQHFFRRDDIIVAQG